MSKITYNADTLKLMTLFENITRTRLKDCFVDHSGMLTFVVEQIYLGKAIGKGASNVKRVEGLLQRKIRIIGFNPDPKEFIKNLIYPLTVPSVEIDGNTIVIKGQDSKTKAFLIGRDQVNIKNNLDIVQKYFRNIEQIKVM